MENRLGDIETKLEYLSKTVDNNFKNVLIGTDAIEKEVKIIMQQELIRKI